MLQKQGIYGSTYENYPTIEQWQNRKTRILPYICCCIYLRCKVVLLSSFFITVTQYGCLLALHVFHPCHVLYFLQLHPYLKQGFKDTFPSDHVLCLSTLHLHNADSFAFNLYYVHIELIIHQKFQCGICGMRRLDILRM